MKPHLTAGLLLALAAGVAGAETSMRCGTDLIQTGDTKIAVLEACGRPDEPRVDRGLLQSTGIERWIYTFANRFTYIVTFDGLRVERIEVVTEQ